MDDFDIEGYVSRSRALDLSGIAWEDVPHHPLPAGAVRALRYMQDIESHTIIYLRTLLSTRAVDDPQVAAFLACWLYEETFHGRALARFLEAAGYSTVQRARTDVPLAQGLERVATGLVAKAWPDFVAVHMTWGAINELTTLTGYQRLSAVAGHPILADILARIIKDESRHFFFYFRQAQGRLERSHRTARITRFLIDHFWAPVGSGVQPAAETRFLIAYLLGDDEGRAAARKVDETIRRLPGFRDVRLLEAHVDRQLQPSAERLTPPPVRPTTAVSLTS